MKPASVTPSAGLIVEEAATAAATPKRRTRGTVTRSVLLTDAVHNKIQQLAGDDDRAFSKVVDRLIRPYLTAELAEVEAEENAPQQRKAA